MSLKSNVLEIEGIVFIQPKYVKKLWLNKLIKKYTILMSNKDICNLVQNNSQYFL